MSSTFSVIESGRYFWLYLRLSYAAPSCHNLPVYFCILELMPNTITQVIPMLWQLSHYHILGERVDEHLPPAPRNKDDQSSEVGLRPSVALSLLRRENCTISRVRMVALLLWTRHWRNTGISHRHCEDLCDNNACAPIPSTTVSEYVYFSMWRDLCAVAGIVRKRGVWVSLLRIHAYY